jgi:hypothetical protein
VKVDPTYIVGIRVNIDGPECDFYTVWFEGEDEKDRVATRNGRIQWVRRVEKIRLIEDSAYSWDSVPDELRAVCGISSMLHSISNTIEGDPNVVGLAIDLLGDFIYSCPDPLPAPQLKILDALAVGLFEEQELSTLVPSDHFQAVADAVMAGLGRVFAFSDFLD